MSGSELTSRHLRVKANNGMVGGGGGRRGRRVRGQHFTEIKTLNKQKINIHYVYKLQHYEPVGHITQKKNLQYLQSLILKKFSKKQ